MRRLGIAALAVAAMLAAAPANACSCPKEQLMKKYGTVSQVLRPVPLPPPLPSAKLAPPSSG